MFFYVADVDSGHAIGEEAQRMFAHRLQPGEHVQLTNLQGLVAQARILRYDKQKKVFEFICEHIEEAPVHTQVLFQALLDKQYMEKWAETIGFAHFKTIYLFPAERSQKRTLELERLKKIMIQSVLLAERAWLPEIITIEDSRELREHLLREQPVVCDMQGQPKSTSLEKIIVGPEGGFSPGEYALFDSVQLKRVHLGDHVYPGWLAGFVASL